VCLTTISWYKYSLGLRNGNWMAVLVVYCFRMFSLYAFITVKAILFHWAVEIKTEIGCKLDFKTETDRLDEETDTVKQIT